MGDLTDRSGNGQGVALGFISRGAKALVAPASWNHMELVGRLFCLVRALPGLTDFSFTSIQVNINVNLPMHVDVDIVGTSLVLSGGEYTGGDFLLGDVLPPSNQFSACGHGFCR